MATAKTVEQKQLQEKESVARAKNTLKQKPHGTEREGARARKKSKKDQKIVRRQQVTDPEENKIGSEIMHILLDAPPPTNINGVYQETGITNVEADKAHRVLKNKVEKKD